MSPIYRRGNPAVSDCVDIRRGPPLVDDPERMQQMWRNSDRWPNVRLTTDLRKAVRQRATITGTASGGVGDRPWACQSVGGVLRKRTPFAFSGRLIASALGARV